MTDYINTQPFNIEPYAHDVLRQLRMLVPFDSGSILRYDSGSGMLLPSAYLGPGSGMCGPLALGEGIIGRAAQSQATIVVHDMRSDARCRFCDPDSRAEIALPLVVADNLIGVLNVESHTSGAYTPEHHAVLQAFANQVALVMQYASDFYAMRHDRDILRYTVNERQRETAALYRLAIITSTSRHVEEMLPGVVREAADMLECDGAQVLLPDPVTYSLQTHADSRFGVTKSWPVVDVPLNGSGHAVHVYHTGSPYIANAPQPAPEIGPGCDTYLICPLNTHGRTLGVLELVNQRSGQFTDANLAIAQTIANQIAVSLASVQRLTAEQRRTEMLSHINRVSQDLYATLDPQDLLRRVAQQALDVFGHDTAHVLLLAPDGQTIQVQAAASRTGDPLPNGYAFPTDNAILGHVLRSGQSHIVADVRDVQDSCPLIEALPWTQSCLIVALRQGDETIGTLNLTSTQLHAFSELERDALEMLARQVSVALENAHLYHQAQRRLIEQGIVHQIGQDLAAILDYRDLSEAIVQHMNRALSTSACVLGLYEDDHQAVRIEADYRAPRHHDQQSPRLNGQYVLLETHPPIQDAIRTRKPVTVYHDDPSIDDTARALLEKTGDHSQLIVPMVTGSRVIGIVDWTDNQAGRRFTQDDQLLARTLVAQATIAFENALLFRQLEQRADELAEAYRLRSQFLATVSHELRTPMNSIIGFTETLIDGIYGAMNDEQISRMDRIRKNSYNLLALIDDLLDLSKIEAGRMNLDIETIGMGDVAHTAVDSLRSQIAAKELALALAIPDDLPRVQADPQRLYQMVKNLLSNAIKFTHEGGITVRCAPVEHNGRPYVSISVEDTGIGISKDAQQFIFDSFRQADSSSTRAYGGTGMGLTITKKLVEMMHGIIEVESTEGEGSTFTLALPIATDERSDGN